MGVNVKINGVWKEIGKNITWEEYEAHVESVKNKHIKKLSSDLKVSEYNFDVLDFERNADSQCLILRFPTTDSLSNFVEDMSDDSDIHCKVLEDTLVKVVLW